jgi:drug/metabolite transporter (DMT)-like permease
LLGKLPGPLLIGIASLLWATDALFRLPAIHALDATFIVFVEHALGVLLLLPALALGRRARLFRLSAVEWVALMLIGAGASALATVLFTASFQFVNPSVAILLQKLQPAMVILMAHLFLGERPARFFFGWAAVALLAAVWLSFPDLAFPSFLHIDMRSRGVLLSLAAAGLWAGATVGGRFLAPRLDAAVITFWRFVFGLLVLGALLMMRRTGLPSASTVSPEMVRSLIYMSLFPGLLAMLLYYQGLQRTSASVATFVELLFPVGAVLLNTFVLKLPLESVQLLAGCVLLFAVARLSRDQLPLR